jgi:hypothetical protein
VLAVENRGNFLGLAEATGSAAAGAFARRDSKLIFFHGFVPPVTPELEAGVMEKGAEFTGRASPMQSKLCLTPVFTRQSD